MQRFRPLIENLEIFVIRVNAPGGFADNAELRQVRQGCCHWRYAEFQFLARTGNREDRLRSADTGTASLKVRASTTKNGKSAEMRLHPDLVAALRESKGRDVKDEEPVFKRTPRIERFRRDLFKAGIPLKDSLGRKVVFHSLRHTFGTNLARGGVASRVAMALMRHSDRRLTDRIYTDESLLGTASGAYALFLDDLFHGATQYALAYQRAESFAVSQRLFRHWRTRCPQLEPGDEYALVDEYAEMVGLKGWYAWTPDPGTHAVTASPHQEGTSNPELLRRKTTPAVYYCLDALKRYDTMPAEKIRELAFEISMVGRNGLDYASPDQKYNLQSLPDEKFSGLHLMCLMYAGFKRIAPEHDLHMD